jgi:5'-phosphate synthase pdxT subunit
MDIAVERNAYGRQIDSRVVDLEPGSEFGDRVGLGKLEAVFIRAPIIREVRGDVKVLAEYAGGSGADRAGTSPGGDVSSGVDSG